MGGSGFQCLTGERLGGFAGLWCSPSRQSLTSDKTQAPNAYVQLILRMQLTIYMACAPQDARVLEDRDAGGTLDGERGQLR